MRVNVLRQCWESVTGAQLIASALGARVYPGPHKEIGWFGTERTSSDPGLFQFPEAARAFHWHGETFDPPPGASRLARSAGCETQAFQKGRAEHSMRAGIPSVGYPA